MVAKVEDKQRSGPWESNRVDCCNAARLRSAGAQCGKLRTSAVVRIGVSWLLAYNDKPVVNDEDSLQSPVNGDFGDENGVRCRVGLDDCDCVVRYRVDVLAIVLNRVKLVNA